MLFRLSLFFCLASLTAGAQTRSVALTFDDLPLAETSKSSSPAAINQRLLATLASHHAPAIGFVNTAKLLAPGMSEQDRATLEDWLQHGQQLGNHTFSHADLNKLSVAAFEQEIISGEDPLRSLLAKSGKRLEYFRFPYNHTGDTREKHDTIAAFLTQRGYQLAPCTIDTSDYIFDRAYAAAFANQDTVSAAKIRSAYLSYTAREIGYYTDLHRQVFRREIPHVLLLHVDQLNADTLEQILAIFESKHYTFVTLAAALSDSAYQHPDTVVTAYGPMWGYRWARERGVKVDGSAEPEPPEWISAYSRH